MGRRTCACLLSQSINLLLFLQLLTRRFFRWLPSHSDVTGYNSIQRCRHQWRGRMPARCVRAYFLIRRRTCASNKPFKLDAQWGERTSVDIRNSAHARC
jgi:hypothetical protein